MKSSLSFCNTSFLVAFLFTVSFLAGCNSSQKSSNQDSITKKSTTVLYSKKAIAADNAASVELTQLIRKVYKWHETAKMKFDGFKPLKRNATDTLYTSIDLDENQKAIEELKQTGLFASSFLSDYRKIAERMDKELRDGSSLWPEGELSTFGDDADAWCNCQDFPVDQYWNIIKLVDVKINNNDADFKWTWGDSFLYKAKATKENGNWRISYLQGFDMNAYNWEWWKKNKK
jgi:hypothetical protein